MNNFFGYSVVEKLKFISFNDEINIKDENKFNNHIDKKNVTISKYQKKINTIKNDKIKKSLIELTKVFKKK